MSDEETREVLKGKGYSDEQIDVILNPPSNLNSDDPDDPPEAKAAVGPKLKARDILEEDFRRGVETKGDRFISRILSPKYDPIKKGSSDLAESKYCNKMDIVAKEHRRKNKLLKLTFEDDWAPPVEALRPEDWVRPTTRKAPKWGKRWDELYDARLYAKEALEKMRVDTPEARSAKMAANLDMMRALKLVSVGILSLADFKKKCDELIKGKT